MEAKGLRPFLLTGGFEMASRYYGVSKGVNTVTESASTTSKQLELIVDLSKSLVKSEVLQILEMLEEKILAGSFPVTTAALLYKAFYMNRGQNFTGIASGTPGYATGTVTMASVLANDTFDYDGTVFTAKTGSPGAAEWDRSLASNTLVAADLVRVFNATAATAAKAVATSALGVVTFTPVLPGTAANSFTLASSDGTRLAVSAATMTGGTEVTSGDVRLKILMSAAYKKADFAVGIQRLEEHLIKGNWPPA